MHAKPRIWCIGLATGAVLTASSSAAFAAPARHQAEVAATARYVAVNGDDSNAGTLAAPLQTVQRAVDLAQPGDTIFIRGGTYAPSRKFVTPWATMHAPRLFV